MKISLASSYWTDEPYSRTLSSSYLSFIGAHLSRDRMWSSDLLTLVRLFISLLNESTRTQRSYDSSPKSHREESLRGGHPRGGFLTLIASIKRSLMLALMFLPGSMRRRLPIREYTELISELLRSRLYQ